jgi:hypothetical protein
MIRKQEFNMTSTFKQGLKNPNSKTLKFSGEEKSRSQLIYVRSAVQRVLDIVSAKTAVAGIQKGT